VPEFFNVLTPAEARATLETRLTALVGTERIDPRKGLGRVVAETLCAPSSLPAFSRSTMDGYAVRAHDTYGASEALPAYLTIHGEVSMGQAARLSIGPGEAAKVHTGSALPEGADAVVMLENTQLVDESTMEILRPVAPGENMLNEGDDVKAGAVLLEAGRCLRPQDIGGLMALGILEASVFLRPRVAILSTGDEVVPPEREPQTGQVRDVNTHTISALSVQSGAIPLPLGIAPDSYEQMSGMARRGLADSEVLVISAGSSVSARDMTSRVIASLGEPGVLAHGVSLRPGKPAIVALIDGKPVFGLPGNPVSAMVVFDLLVRPAIHRVGGCVQPRTPVLLAARLTHNIPSTTGREDYVPVRIEEGDGETWAEPIFGESNLITTMIQADGLARIPLDKHGLSAGETVSVRLF